MPDFRTFGKDKVRDRDDGGCPYLTGVDGNPIFGEITMAENFFHCGSLGQPAALNLLYRVEGFGRIVLGTLPLPDRSSPYCLPVELARAKLAQIEDRRNAWHKDGFVPSRIIKEDIARAGRVLVEAEQQESYSPSRCAALAEKSLSRATWAGESMAIEAARYGMERRIADGSARSILIGANFFGFGKSDEYNRLFEQVFNFATLPFYWKSFEPEQNAEQWARIDSMLDWLLPRGIKAKGHPLVWFYEPCYPAWAGHDSFEAIRKVNARRVQNVVSRCRGRIACWDVINEAQDADHANVFGFARPRLLEITAAAAEAAKAANPDALAIINVCSPFGEYAAAKPGKWTPWEYLEACVKSNVPFDAIGVQYYYGAGWGYCRDMLSVSAQLDKYAALGKPIHVTEIGCPSSCETDFFHQLGSATVDQAGQWHGKWSETLQAEWVERFYTICCGKPYIDAITWWDLADYQGHFFTHAGLLHDDYTPKPAYHRLLNLVRKLGIKT